jgi:predicted RNA-binding Zn-ribbon protein involved in translation (DUF1610 family)
MEDVIWFSAALILTFAALVLVLAGIRAPKPRIEENAGRCPSCATPMSPRRVSLLKSQCPHCGMKVDKSRRIDGAAV